MKNKIKLFDPFIDKSEEMALNKILKSKFWASGSGVGTVDRFENEFKSYTKAKSCIAVNSGTAALNLALSAFNLKNKEVILPSLSFVSTAHAITLNGGIPVFADINPETLCIDPDAIRKLISKKTKMIVTVHFGGLAANLSEIKSI